MSQEAGPVEVAAEPARPSDDDRSLASLAHFIQFVGGPLGPFLIFVIKRKSPFVAFHALQALIWELVFMGTMITSMFGFMAVMFATVTFDKTEHNAPPRAFFLFPIIWLAIMGLWLVTIAMAVIFGMRANRGEWAEYPVIGKWARRWSGGTAAGSST